jgi:hypothetical protein
MNFFTALFAALSIAVAVNAAAIDVRCTARGLGRFSHPPLLHPLISVQAVDAGVHPATNEDFPRCF